MTQPGSPVPPAQPAQRPNRRRLWITLGVLGGLVYVALQALSGAAFFYLSNPSLSQNKTSAAPSGWHTATPPGQATSYSYAVSADAPGLILACGVSLSTSLTSFGKWDTQLWRTDDGGAHWRTLQAPFLKGNDECEIAAISGSETTFFAYGQRLASSAATTIWVTQDSGATWTQAFTTQGSHDEYTAMRELSASVMRDGVLYGMHSSAFFKPLFSSSVNEGATWTTITRTSASKAPDGEIESLVADYAQPHAWYQLVRPETAPVTLEHSADDGATWTAVTQFPRGGATPSALATSSARPDQLCAYDFETDSSASGSQIVGDTTLFASADSGATWRQATLPVRNGDSFGPVRVGPNGCYLAFEEEIKGGFLGYAHNVSIWRLSAETTSSEQVVMIKNFHFSYSANAPGFTYAPAANGMEARFVISATREPRSWLDFFGGNARNLTTDQLLWAPAP